MDTPEDILLRKERRNLVRDKLSYLGHMDREIILMRLERKPVSFSKIAKCFGRSKSTIYKRYLRSIKKIGEDINARNASCKK